jgi:L-ascorbate metabolism protein UlaG (beta-lactamase superfamily)
MTLSITYAGHSAVILSIAGKHVAIDPWLEGSPVCPPGLKNPAHLDLIVLSHGHADHASDVVRLAQQTKAKVAATYELAMILIGEGIPGEQIVAMNKGGTTIVDGVTVTLTNAYHSSSFDSPTKGTLYAGEACGVVVSGKGATVYHAGDTCLFSDMKLIGEAFKPDVALLPIGDLFTMGPRDAATAAQYVQAKVALPIHYKTFGLLTGTYAEFADACRKLNVESVELQIGETRSF